MQRAERRLAEREGCAVRTLAESDYLLGVADETRQGALRFHWAGDDTYPASIRADVPAMIELGRLFQITERILRDEKSDEDLQLIFSRLIPGRRAADRRDRQSDVEYRHCRAADCRKPQVLLRQYNDVYRGAAMERWEWVCFQASHLSGYRR
ncbi:hypothetical protein [Sphingobium aromaticivastans]|uniref:hypothetical protein n=1 Tax=Sphingobium aromaticivastans TaxID=1778665 RepID=UPI00301881D8